MPYNGRPTDRPKADPQPKDAGANATAYTTGVTPRARYARSNATATWHNATAGITRELHCNIRPRISLADALSAEAARALSVNARVPGRRPAPRVEIGCGDTPDTYTEPTGALARDLAFRKPQTSPLNPDGGPPAGPGPTPPGLNPLPPPRPPTAPPAQPPSSLPAPPAPPATPPTSPWPSLPPYTTNVPGTLQAINFHFTGDIAGGDATSEIRVHGPVGVPFILRQLWINADTGVTPGQFLDVLVSSDGDTTDIIDPSGQSIFPLLNNAGALPTPDDQRGIAIPASLQDLRLAYRVDNANAWLKLRSFFVAPAAALANLHVTLVIERMDNPGMNPPPLMPRPPIGSPSAPPAIPQPLPPLGTPPLKSTPLIASGPFIRLQPAWQVAAQGLQISYAGNRLNYDPRYNPYAAWLLDRNAPLAQSFRDRIDRVLTAAGLTAGTPDSLVDRNLALTANP